MLSASCYSRTHNDKGNLAEMLWSNPCLQRVTCRDAVTEPVPTKRILQRCCDEVHAYMDFVHVGMLFRDATSESLHTKDGPKFESTFSNIGQDIYDVSILCYGGGLQCCLVLDSASIIYISVQVMIV